MLNVPNDWGNYFRACPSCGTRYHASEGGCDCDELRREVIEQRIWGAVKHVASWLTGAIDVGPGAIVTLPQALSAICGYDNAGELSLLESSNRATLVRLLRQVASHSGESIELRVTGQDGEIWTDEIFEIV